MLKTASGIFSLPTKIPCAFKFLQVFIALGIVNVWLIRPKLSSAYRGANAKNLKEEFLAYGYPSWFIYAIGGCKLMCASFLILGFLTGLSLILAIGAQNVFVIEQGLKRNHIFLVCLICSVSDFIFIVIGTTAFYFFSQTDPVVDLILNLLLLVFIFYFIWNKLKVLPEVHSFNMKYKKDPVGQVVLKTFAFTYLNPHVYTDTILIIGGFSREFIFNEKIAFVVGASISSFIYFFSLGYASSYFSNFINNQSSWRLINRIVIATMLFLSIYVLNNM